MRGDVYMHCKKAILSTVLAFSVSISMSVVALPQIVSAADNGSSNSGSQISKKLKESYERYKATGACQDTNAFRVSSTNAKKLRQLCLQVLILEIRAW